MSSRQYKLVNHVTLRLISHCENSCKKWENEDEYKTTHSSNENLKGFGQKIEQEVLSRYNKKSLKIPKG